MADTVTQLAKRLIPAARHQYAFLQRKRREVLWGDTATIFRVRQYPKSKTERVSLVMPNFHTFSLYSEVLKRKVELTMTRRLLREVEAAGGIDKYLLQTPDRLLNSDTASQLKWQISCAAKNQEYRKWLASRSQVQDARTASTLSMLGSSRPDRS